MSLKFTLIAVIAVSFTIVGCRAGNNCWTKQGYQGAPAAGSASRTYTPTESISPYQQQAPATYGGSGTTYSEPANSYNQQLQLPTYNTPALPSYGGAVNNFNQSLPNLNQALPSGGSSFGGSGAR